jgi:hypothetical protein
MAEESNKSVAGGALPYRTKTITLAANEIKDISGNIRFLTILTATTLSGIQISFNGATFSAFPPGLLLRDFEAEIFWIKNTNAGPNTITIGIGQADVRDSRVTIDALNPLPVTGPLTNNELRAALVPTRGAQIHVSGEFTRAAAAATYSAGDVIADNTVGQTLASIAGCAEAAGRGGVILAASLFVDQATLPTGWGTIRVWLYEDTITQLADNAVNTVLYANRAKLCGFIDFATWTSKATNCSYSQVVAINMPFVTAGTALYFVVETVNALTSNLALNANFSLHLDILKA